MSNFQKERLTPSVYSALILAYEIEKFKFCGPSDDPDEQTAVVYGFKHMAKRFSGMITKIPMIEIPSNINFDIEHIVEAYDLHSDLQVVIDNLRSIIADSERTKSVISHKLSSQMTIEESKNVQPTKHDMKDKPKVFIASSAESLEVAEAINLNLDHDTESTLWKDAAFS